MSNEAKILIGVGLLTLVILIGGVFFISNTSKTLDPEALPSERVDASLLIRPDSFQTNPDAAITIVEFGDYQCPACASVHPTVARIVEERGEEVNLVFRHFPLPQHKNAKQAAYAAEAAGLQGKFWQMHDLLYENQKEWENEGSPQEYFEEYATELELNMGKFREDVKSDEVKDKVERDKNDGTSVSVNSTPTFYINGYEYKGAMDFTQFEQAINLATEEIKTNTASPTAIETIETLEE